MTWLPWILLVATLALAGWCSAELGRCLTWARRALLRGQPARRPEGRLVRWLGLDELLRAVETRTSGEGEIRAAAARRIEALLAPLTDAVLVVDAHDRLRLANPAAVALFGLRPDDAGGAVVPLLTGVIADATSSLAIAFMLPMACYAVIASFGFYARKPA